MSFNGCPLYPGPHLDVSTTNRTVVPSPSKTWSRVDICRVTEWGPGDRFFSVAGEDFTVPHFSPSRRRWRCSPLSFRPFRNRNATWTVGEAMMASSWGERISTWEAPKVYSGDPPRADEFPIWALNKKIKSVIRTVILAPFTSTSFNEAPSDACRPCRC